VPVLDLVFSPDGAALAGIIGPEQPNNLAAGQGEVRIWPVAGGEARRLNAANIGSIGYSPDGKYLATRSANGAIDLWNPATGTHLRRLTGLLVNAGMARIVFSPDSKSIVTPCPGRDVQLRDPATGQVRATLKGHTQQLFDAAFSPDGKLLVTGSIALGQDGESNQAEVIVWERLP
jgi:WD40 repeat protein